MTSRWQGAPGISRRCGRGVGFKTGDFVNEEKLGGLPQNDSQNVLDLLLK